MLISNNCKSLNFGVSLKNDAYCHLYSRDVDYNGAEPDSFIMSKLPQNPCVVYDLGAGQGRNTIPVAQKGHKVFAFEISPEGQKDIAHKASRSNVSDNVKVVGQSILEKIKQKPKADFAYMAHVSQHFNLAELQNLLSNISENLTANSLFVFDALISDSGHIFKNLFKSRAKSVDGNASEACGEAYFKMKDIFKVAEKSGLTCEDITDFVEDGAKRALYEKQPAWGGFDIKGVKKFPVTLKWFVFKK